MAGFRTSLRFGFVLVALSCVHSDAYRIESARNIYVDRLRDYQTACVQKVGPAECVRFQKALVALKAEMGYASDALTKGGSIAPQLSRLDAALKELDAAHIHP